MDLSWILNCRAPQVYYKDDTIKNLKAEVTRGAKLKCTKCGIKGAALGCYVKSCRRSYHVTCAIEISKCRWDYVCYMLYMLYYVVLLVLSLFETEPLKYILCVLACYRKTFCCCVQHILQIDFPMRS